MREKIKLPLRLWIHFFSAPKEARAVIKPREKELFYGARTIGWTLLVFSVLIILGVGVISIWDGVRSGFTFWQFFLRFVLIFSVYKLYDMICFDYFLLMKIHFFHGVKVPLATRLGGRGRNPSLPYLLLYHCYRLIYRS